MEPKFLDEEQIRQLHAEIVRRTGGSDGIRDVGLLLSALEMPKASFGGQFLHEDVYGMAAAYLYHLVQNHPFIDGNKRIGVSAAVVFLYANGIQVTASQDQLADFVWDVAQGLHQKPETPWDTWLLFLRETNCLISWVPPEFVDAVNDGIDVNPEGCISWATDAGGQYTRPLLIAPELKEAGLLG